MSNPLARLLEFLDGLDTARLSHDLKHVADSLLVLVHVPQGYCEVEFFADGTIAAEWFPRGDGAEAVADQWLGLFIAEHRE